jgi:hypothetical protein
MNLDEETFLTAFLDGTLDPDLQHRVESALASDLALAEHFRALTAVHDLVGGLSRPSPTADVSAAVMARIAGRRALVARLARPLGWAAAAAVVAAVSIALAFPNGFSKGPKRRDANPATVARGPERNRVAGRPAADAPVRPASTSTPTAVRVAQSQAGAADSEAPGPDSEERMRDLEQQRIRQLLDSPNLRKVFVVTDVVGGDASRKVGDLLGRSPRRYSSYVCIAVTSGVGAGGPQAGPADVFAVVMDDFELTEFRKELKGAIPPGARVAEAEPRPEQVTQLADIGQVKVFPGTPVADVTVPERAMSFREHRPPDLTGQSSAGGGAGFVLPDPSVALGQPEPAPAAGPTPEQERSAPAHARRDQMADTRSTPQGPATAPAPETAEAARAGGPRPERHPSSVVLVWVTRPARAGSAVP